MAISDKHAASRQLVARRPVRVGRLVLIVAVTALLLMGMLAGLVALGALDPRPGPLAWRLDGLVYNIDGDIYVLPATGEAPVLVAHDPSTHGYWDPHWSPDGRYLMYHETWGAGSLVHVRDADGHPVASFPGWYSTWAPDSSRIATWGQTSWNEVDVRAMDGRIITSVPIPETLKASGDQRPGWTPDGSAIILPHYYLVADGYPEGLQPWVLPLDGGAPRRLSAEVKGLRPAFSPDGTRIAIDTLDGLFLTAADGTGAQLLATPDSGFFAEPLWSPNGDRVAVTTRHYGVDPPPESIQVIDLATGTAVTVLSVPTAEGRFTALEWSPDERMVLVQEWGAGPDGDGSIWSVAADGSGSEIQVERAYEGADWRWVEEGVDGP